MMQLTVTCSLRPVPDIDSVYHQEVINTYFDQELTYEKTWLNIKYSILVKQYALSREFYNFFNQIRESNEETGGIYERTPVQITGNIKCCDGSEMALGYFMASAVKTKRIFILPEEHEIAIGSAYEACGWTTYSNPRDRQVYYPYGTYDDGSILVKSTLKYCVDCRVRGTSIRPDFWE